MSTHGSSINEVPTGVKPPARVTSGLPVYIGTAPVNMGDPTFVGKPGVFYTKDEAIAVLGTPDGLGDWSSYTLLQAIDAHFTENKVGPIVCINVLDPTKASHYAQATGATHVVLPNGTIALQTYGAPDIAVFGIIKSSVVIKKANVAKTLGTDYTLAFDDDGSLVLSIVAGGAIAAGDTITADFKYLDPSGVTANEVITGIGYIEDVYPKLKLVPGVLAAPKYSQTPTVAAALMAAAHSIDTAFRAVAIVELSTAVGTIPTYASAAAWKSNNGYDKADTIAVWGKMKLSASKIFHGSVIVAATIGATDADKNGVPYASPSNKTIPGIAMVLDDGSEVSLRRAQANSLNDQGIVTFLNGFNGWRLWGNRMACYPGTTDVKDCLIPIRRMFSWIGNTIILTTDANVDEPGNRRLIDGVTGTLQLFLNSLIAQGALVDGVIEFRPEENSVTDLSDGKITWHVTLTPPSPAEQMSFTLEYDPTALAALFQ